MFTFVRSNRLLFMTIVAALVAGVGYGLSGKYSWLKTAANVLIILQVVVVASLIVWRIIDVVRFGARGVDITSVGAILVALWAQSYWVAIAVCLVHLFIFAVRSFVDARVNRIANLPGSKLSGSAIVLRGRKQVVTTIEKLSKGDKILVEINSILPVDGILLEDNAKVDESWLNGKTSVAKSKHDTVYAGSINRASALTIKALSSSSGSLASSLVQTLKSSRFTASSFFNTAELFSLAYTLIVIVFATGAFVRGDKAELLATLIAATPLVFIVTPKWFFAIAMNKASRQGIFFKSNRSVELASVMKNILVSDTFITYLGKKVDETIRSLKMYVDSISILGGSSKVKKSEHLEIINTKNLSEKIIAIENAPTNSSVLSLSPESEHSLLQASDLGIQLGSSQYGLAEAADVYILSNDSTKVIMMKAIAKNSLRSCQTALFAVSIMSIGVMIGAAFGYINPWYALIASSVIYLLMFSFVLFTSSRSLNKNF